MLPQYADLRKEIRELDKIKEYIYEEQKINEYIKIVQKNKIENNREDLWFGYYAMARVLFKTKPINYYKKIIENIQKSIKYCGVAECNNKSKSYWLLARTYRECFGECKNKKSLQLYSRCEFYYRSINNRTPEINILLADILNNIVYITKDIDTLKESLDIYESLYKSSDVEKDEIDVIYETAYIIYSHHDMKLHANYYLNKITTDEILHNLQQNQMITA